MSVTHLDKLNFARKTFYSKFDFNKPEHINFT